MLTQNLVKRTPDQAKGNGNGVSRRHRRNAAADDAAIADLEAELKMKRDVRDGRYLAFNEKRSKVGLGVAGSAAYGNDSPLYGAMGFVRKSDRASGLT